MSMPVIAHAGHDIVTLAFFVPTIGFLVWLAVAQIRQRREARGDGSGSGPDG